MTQKSFLSASRITVGWTGRNVVVCTVQKRLVVAGYIPRHPNWCPRLIHNHRYHQWLLEDRPLNWNCQHYSHAIFDDESRVILYHSDHRAVMKLNRQWKRLKDKIELRLILHEKIRHVHYRCRGWLWTHEQKHMRPVLLVPVLVYVCQHVMAAVWSGHSLGHRCGYIERYAAVAKHIWTVQTKTRLPIHLISSTMVLDAERKLFHLMKWKMACSSFDVIVFNRCPCSSLIRLLLSQTWRKTFWW